MIAYFGILFSILILFMMKLGTKYVKYVVMVLLCCSAYITTAQPSIKDLNIYGNSAQFVLQTMSQLSATEATLNKTTRIKIRFRYRDSNNNPYSSWKLIAKSLNTTLQLDGGSSEIPIGNVKLIPSTLNTENTSITVNEITISENEQIVAEGTWNGENPIGSNDIMEAEFYITYTIFGPFTNFDEGVYFANLYFNLAEN